MNEFFVYIFRNYTQKGTTTPFAPWKGALMKLLSHSKLDIFFCNSYVDNALPTLPRNYVISMTLYVLFKIIVINLFIGLYFTKIYFMPLNLINYLVGCMIMNVMHVW